MSPCFIYTYSRKQNCWSVDVWSAPAVWVTHSYIYYLDLSLMNVPTDETHPPHLSGVTTSEITSSLSGPGAFISQLHLFITLPIYTSRCSVHRRIYYQLSVSRLRWRSSDSSSVSGLYHQGTNFTPTRISKAPVVHHTCACCLTIEENWAMERLIEA